MCGFLICTGDTHEKAFEKALATIFHRGPDSTKILNLPHGGRMGFHRLAIMDLHHSGDQPFTISDKKTSLVCNGEIYNFEDIKSRHIKNYSFHSTSDCEVLLPLFLEHDLPFLCETVDAEFALVLYDEESDDWLAARDPMGVRPLFYGYDKNGKICFASEAKSLVDFCEEIIPFPPGHYYQQNSFHCYLDLSTTKQFLQTTEEVVLKGIAERLESAVVKRLKSDAPMGLLLSGGLDSSLVCAIAAKNLKTPITTFAVGIDKNPIDTKYAKVVADYLKSIHHEVLFTTEDVFNCLRDLIYHLETFDITTIRASVGMYLVCKYVKEKTDIKVLLTGEVSDEIFGYKYTDFAPSPEEFQKEAEKRVRELYMYDILRADRCLAANSLEARVPFSDKEFVRYVMSIDPKMKMNTTGVGKYLLRKAFDNGNYLPHDILYREKAAFSDAVGHAMVDALKEMAENKYSSSDLEEAKNKYPHATPFTKESLMYRDIFEDVLPKRAKLIKDFWMPNKDWENCNVDDPSARALPNYGKSGN